MEPIDRILLVPRFRGRASSDFYPWLGRRLAALGWRGELEVVSLRTPEAPEVAATVSALRGRLGAAARAARTVLVGHSVGAQAVLRALAGGPAVAGFVLIGAWWTLDQPDAALRPWIEQPFDWARAAAAAGRRIVLLSTDDPHTADVARTRRLFDQRLGAEVQVHDGARHFERAEEPAVLSALGGLLRVL
ncbi:MAG TPA: alpha/beta hydrolase [Kofleriaceae bacterium]|nr:alpha/beta hydrolase [Kofleriaceae bacterium]